MTIPARTISPRADGLPESILRSPVIASVIASRDGRLLEVNDTFRKLLGDPSLDCVHGRHFVKDFLFRPTDWREWERVIDGEGAHELELLLVAKGDRDVVLRGTVEHVRSSAANGSYLRGLFVDCTEERRFREMVLKMAAAESLLGLAAGVSHDVNNLLTVLIGNLYLVAESLRHDEATHLKLKRARDAAKRGADLLRQLMGLARGADAPSEIAVVSPEKVIASLSPLLAAVLGSQVKLETALDSTAPAVRINRAQLESVITNLVVNARDALAGATGTVSIAVTSVELGDAEARSRRVNPGCYVRFAVHDNGCGIPETHLERVFEPFFSTKGSKGNGLGLAMVRWFAEKAGGTVWLESRPNEGTTVALLLPGETEKGDTSVMTMPLSALPGGDETIVVLSTEPDFRTTIEQILSVLGYTIVSGEPTEDTLAMIGTRRAAAMVLDAQALSEPFVKRINEVLGARDESTGIVVVGDASFKWAVDSVRVAKPFSLGELTRAIRTAIEGD